MVPPTKMNVIILQRIESLLDRIVVKSIDCLPFYSFGPRYDVRFFELLVPVAGLLMLENEVFDESKFWMQFMLT